MTRKPSTTRLLSALARQKIAARITMPDGTVIELLTSGDISPPINVINQSDEIMARINGAFGKNI